MLCPQVIREECPSLRGLFGSMEDERAKDKDNSSSSASQGGNVNGEDVSHDFKVFVGRKGYGLAAVGMEFDVMDVDDDVMVIG